uniref:Eva-1 homolog A, regulator of programmed cell death n=1 Tax=Eptatretus burgeri TaxID=7764 RepID=A0A8C4QV04_EPTBU
MANDTRVVSGSHAMLLSNVLATFEHPERAALVCLSGLVVGLLLTLCGLVYGIHCRRDCRRLRGKAGQNSRRAASDSGNSDSEDSESSSSSVARAQHLAQDFGTPTNVFTSAEEIEMAQRLEERERILNEIWRNGRTDVVHPSNLSHYY